MNGSPEFIAAEVAYRSERVSKEFASARRQPWLLSRLQLRSRAARRNVR